MNIIKIDAQLLTNIIAENCDGFGNSFAGIYVDASGALDYCEKSNSGGSMPILEFSGMGEFVDENQNYCSDDDYDCVGVAEYIVNDKECLLFDGAILQDDGTEIEYKFELSSKKA